MKKEYNPHYLFVFIILTLALEAIFFSVGNLKLNQEIIKENEKITKIQNVLINLPIQAKAYSVYNISKNNKIYGKNDDIALPLASIVKVMTVIVALTNNISNQTLQISDKAIKQNGDFGLFVNERWSIDDLAKLTLISSANDGAYVLADNENFLEKMNLKAIRIGMLQASFLNSTGLDTWDRKAGALATAEDVNLMITYAFRAHPEIFQVTTLPEINLTSLSGFNHTFKNTDTMVNKIPNLLFSKTGFTSSAGGNLAIIFKNKNGDEIAVTVLGSTFLGRFLDMEKIVKVLYNF